MTRAKARILKIQVYTLMLPERWEIIEDDLRDYFISKGINATIDNDVTCNTTQANGEMLPSMRRK